MKSEQLRDLVIKYKDDNNLSDFDVAVDMGISQDTVRRFRQGDELMPRTLEKIEKFFTHDPCIKSPEEQKYVNVLNRIKLCLFKMKTADDSMTECFYNDRQCIKCAKEKCVSYWYNEIERIINEVLQ